MNVYFKSSEKVKILEAGAPMGKLVKTTHLALAMGSIPLFPLLS